MTKQKNYSKAPLVFSTWLDKGGSAAVRVRRPMEVLQQHGMAQSRFEDSAWPEELVGLLKPDVFLWQRCSETGHAEYMAKCRKAVPSSFHIYETDDALDQVPEKSAHKPHMRADIADGIIECAKLCDAVVVSTDDLSKHMRSLLGPGIDIRVVPNMMAERDFVRAAEIRAQIGEHRPLGRKPRIGWGGGISHAGDLELLIPVIEHFGNRVTWVFLGMQPGANLRTPVEFHEGVSTEEYIPKLASLALDLMVAPLEDHLFNRCKSNLRLLEGGVCAYPTIASPVSPYLTRHPPVVGYASSTKEWIAEIEKFLALSVPAQKKHGKALHAWVRKFYVLDEHVEDRLAAWLPSFATFFKPNLKNLASPRNRVSVVGMVVPGDETFVPAASLEEALATEDDVLWLRPLTGFILSQAHKMKQVLNDATADGATDDVKPTASVSAMTNGTGSTGFPNREQFFNCSGENADAINNICADLDTSDADICFPNGPAIMLSRRALNLLGPPQFHEFVGEDGKVNEEAAIYEWGLAAHAAGFSHRVAGVYAIASHTCEPFDAGRLGQYAHIRYGIDSNVPDVCKPIRRDIELTYHKKFYRPTPLSVGNYQEWADVWDTITDEDVAFFKTETPIDNAKFYVVPPGGSIAEIIGAAKADCNDKPQWLVVAQPGELRPHALWMMAHVAKPDTVAIYGDHDYLDEKGGRRDPDFKPLPLDHDLLLARDYVTPICALNLAHLDESLLGDVEVGVYACFLDLLQRFGKERIVHVPAILFHAAASPQPIETLKRQVRRKAIVANRHAQAMGWRATVRVHPNFPTYAQVLYHPPVSQPKVSIIIPTKNKVEMLQPCIDTIFAFTDYPNFEVIIVDNGSTNPKHITYRKSLEGQPKIKLLEWDFPFNFSSINNYASKFADGEFLLLLNDDTRIVPESSNWLSLMVGCGERAHVGTVGAKLVHPWQTIQHVGVVDEFSMCGHYHHGLPVTHVGYQGIALLTHESTANTAACILIRKALYDELGGLDERMPSNFGDVALCHDVYKKGLVNVTVMDAILQHYETVTRKHEPPETMRREGLVLREHWNQPDPLWNRNLAIIGYQGQGGMQFDLPAWPGLEHPWRKLMDRKPKTVLVLGDYNDEIMRKYLAAGDHVFQTTVAGGSIYLIHPLMQNVEPLDIRYPQLAKPILEGLGVDTIVLRSLRNAPLETLGFLTNLGVNIHYEPREGDDERMTPIPGRLNFSQEDIDVEGTPWGQVNRVAWKASWEWFLDRVKDQGTQS